MNKLAQQMKIIDSVMTESLIKLKAAKNQKPSGYETTIEINGYEFDCIVDYEIEPACKGGRGDFGMKTEPDEPASITMGQVWIFDSKWNILDVPEQAMKDVLDEILEHEG